MCDFTHWTATGVMIDLGAFEDLAAREGWGAGGPSMMLTVIGVGTCEHAGWRHSLARPSGRIVADPTVEVFQVVASAPGGEDRLTHAVVEWTGPANPEAKRVELRSARSDGGSAFVEIEVRG